MEAELRRVLASVTDCLWSAELDDAGKCEYRYFSEVVEEITGLPAEFFLPGIHRWYSVVHPDDQTTWSQAMARHRAGTSTEVEYRVVWPDGASRWVRERVQVSRGTADHGRVRLDGVLTDISQRKAVERALDDSEQRFRAFVQHSPYIAVIKDADRRYHYANRPFLEFVRKSEEELLRRRDHDIFPADIAEKVAERDGRAIASGEPMQTTEFMRGPNGVPHMWFVTRFTLTDSSCRRFLGSLAVDVTELKRVTG
jgi:PAS domain S-box-containing protein